MQVLQLVSLDIPLLSCNLTFWPTISIEHSKLNSQYFRVFLFYHIDVAKHLNPTSFIPHLYQDLPPIGSKNDSNASNSGHADLDISTSMIPTFGSKLGLMLPDPAPDVAPNPDISAAPAPFNGAQSSKYCHQFTLPVYANWLTLCILFTQIKWLIRTWIYRIQTNPGRRNTQKKHGPVENHYSADCNNFRLRNDYHLIFAKHLYIPMSYCNETKETGKNNKYDCKKKIKSLFHLSYYYYPPNQKLFLVIRFIKLFSSSSH